MDINTKLGESRSSPIDAVSRAVAIACMPHMLLRIRLPSHLEASGWRAARELALDTGDTRAQGKEEQQKAESLTKSNK
jgi:hypothetical protein